MLLEGMRCCEARKIAHLQKHQTHSLIIRIPKMGEWYDHQDYTQGVNIEIN